jgi:hypothetical protein
LHLPVVLLHGKKVRAILLKGKEKSHVSPVCGPYCHLKSEFRHSLAGFSHKSLLFKSLQVAYTYISFVTERTDRREPHSFAFTHKSNASMKTSATNLIRSTILGAALLGLTSVALGQLHPNHFQAPVVCTAPAGSQMTATVLYSQIGLLCDIGSFSENFVTNVQFNSETADDFVVPPQGWEVTQIEVVGGGFNAPYPAPTSFDIAIYNDVAGLPGPVFAALPNLPAVAEPPANPGRGTFVFDIPPLVIPAGTYWLSVISDGAQVNPGGVPFHIARFQWFLPDVLGTAPVLGGAKFRDAGSLVAGCDGLPPFPLAWFEAGPCYGVEPFDVAFALGGRELPVELVSFDAIRSGADILLRWVTASETDNAGFNVEHAAGDGDFAQLGFVEGHGTTLLPQEYSFRVADLGPGVHRFRLKQIDYDGAFEYSETVETFIGIPGQMVLEPAYPNPFNPSTTLRFAVANEQVVTLALHDATGRVVRTVFNGAVTADDMHSVTVDASGLSSGLYVAVLTGESISMSRNLLLSK